MADIKIVVDTGADMPKKLVEKYNIGVLSFLSIFGEDTYVSGVDITNDEFFDKLEEYDGFPTTSQTPYGDMYDFFMEQCKNHDEVIYFTLSSKASGQYNTAHLVRDEIIEDYPEAKLHIVDSEKFSLYIAVTAVHAAEMVNDGKSAEEIIAECKEYIKTWRAYLLVDTLEYLQKGGRISKASAFVGSLLELKPILTIENGLVESYDKLRGKKKLLDKLIEKVQEDPDFDDEKPEFMVVQSDEEKGQELMEKLEDEYGEGCVSMYGQFGAIIGTHVGRGAVAVISRIK